MSHLNHQLWRSSPKVQKKETCLTQVSQYMTGYSGQLATISHKQPSKHRTFPQRSHLVPIWGFLEPNNVLATFSVGYVFFVTPRRQQGGSKENLPRRFLAGYLCFIFITMFTCEMTNTEIILMQKCVIFHNHKLYFAELHEMKLVE